MIGFIRGVGHDIVDIRAGDDLVFPQDVLDRDGVGSRQNIAGRKLVEVFRVTEDCRELRPKKFFFFVRQPKPGKFGYVFDINAHDEGIISSLDGKGKIKDRAVAGTGRRRPDPSAMELDD